MHGTVEVLRKRKVSKESFEIIVITPDMATEMLEANKLNRPLRQDHVKSIARAITEGRWKYNARPITFDTDGNIADGQHRLWAIFESGMAVKSAVAYGVEREAFATIDTNCVLRSGGDIVALCGLTRNRNVIASALAWLMRYQKGAIPNYRATENKITNDRIEHALAKHPGIVQAAERVGCLRKLCNVSQMATFYYILSNRDSLLADQMVDTLEDPAGVATHNAFFKLRKYFIDNHNHTKDPIMSFALMIKAANAAKARQRVERLYWRGQGRGAEPFPKLEV